MQRSQLWKAKDLRLIKVTLLVFIRLNALRLKLRTLLDQSG
jgi:hypothetical protein